MTSPPMRIVVFGLSLSSSWGNGHATTWRALLAALAKRGHEITFFERDVQWYRDHRDLHSPDFCKLEFYEDLGDLQSHHGEVAAADIVILGSFVPEGVALANWIFARSEGPVAFYDIDTPVTVAALEVGGCSYLDPRTLRKFDLYLSFTGGLILNELQTRFGAARTSPLYCSVDERLYRPLDRKKVYDLAYLGTYSADRQPWLDEFLIKPARMKPNARFVVAGPQYPDTIDWPSNVDRIDHVAPADHAEFYNATRFALNVTRADMVKYGYSPSVRIFEAAACGVAIISDDWKGLETILSPGQDILIAGTSHDIIRHLELSEQRRDEVAAHGRNRVLQQHTAARRALELETYLRALLDPRKVHAAANAAMQNCVADMTESIDIQRRQ